MNFSTMLANFDYSWLAQLSSLLVLPFAHADVAIVLGAYMVVNDLMPASLVVVSLYCGMIASDFALYGIGVGARHLPWLGRWAVDDRVLGVSEVLERNLFGLVALCRMVPGVAFVSFIACGWSRVPLGRFALASAGAAVFYLPVMLCLAVVFGDAIDDHAGLWTWPALWVAMVLGGYARKRVLNFGEGNRAGAAAGPHADDGAWRRPSRRQRDGLIPAFGGSGRRLHAVSEISGWLARGRLPSRRKAGSGVARVPRRPRLAGEI